ncbi:hypothetical protein MJL33_34770, partial [Salmonella enterica subsp. enterica serovar Kentucky]|nr:hypothetical protein [Salmonella enterica subsp. enterica serovar Kentucky]
LMQMMPQVLPSPDAMGPPAPVPDPATGITQPSAGQTAPVSTQQDCTILRCNTGSRRSGWQNYAS